MGQWLSEKNSLNDIFYKSPPHADLYKEKEGYLDAKIF